MIIYGSKAVHLNSAQLTTTTCPSCNTQGSITASVFRRHAHIFWIPLFPIGKKGGTECQHCKQVLEPSAMPLSIKKEYDKINAASKGPIWQYIGLVIIAVFAVFIYVSGEKNKELEQSYLITPLVGDVYRYEIETSRYSTLKVISVSEDSVFVSQNEYETNKKKSVSSIDKEENYSEFTFGISKERISQMYNQKAIYSINR